MPHLLHIFLLQHFHAAFIYRIKHKLYIPETFQHLQKAKNFFLLKVMEQTSCSNQKRRIRHVPADLPEPSV